MIPNTSVPRALRASVQGTELLQKQKCVETLNANADSVLRSTISGNRIRKTSAVSRGQGRVWEGMPADFGILFLGAGLPRKTTEKMLKSKRGKDELQQAAKS